MMDRSHWSVLPDWEAVKGIKNDVMSVINAMVYTLEHPLETMFRGDVFFTLIARHLFGKSAGDLMSEQ